jgi:hypothetical protein
MRRLIAIAVTSLVTIATGACDGVFGIDPQWRDGGLQSQDVARLEGLVDAVQMCPESGTTIRQVQTSCISGTSSTAKLTFGSGASGDFVVVAVADGSANFYPDTVTIGDGSVASKALVSLGNTSLDVFTGVLSNYAITVDFSEPVPAVLCATAYAPAAFESATLGSGSGNGMVPWPTSVGGNDLAYVAVASIPGPITPSTTGDCVRADPSGELVIIDSTSAATGERIGSSGASPWVAIEVTLTP